MPDRQPKLAPVTATGRDVWLASGRDLVRRRSEESWLFADWIREGVEMMGSEAIGLVLEITGNSLGKIYDYLVSGRKPRFSAAFRRESIPAAISHWSNRWNPWEQ